MDTVAPAIAATMEVANLNGTIAELHESRVVVIGTDRCTCGCAHSA